MTAATRIPEATLREEWSAAYVAWTRAIGPVMDGAPTSDAARPADLSSDRASRLADSLLCLAADPRATGPERALAAQRAADLLTRA